MKVAVYNKHPSNGAWQRHQIYLLSYIIIHSKLYKTMTLLHHNSNIDFMNCLRRYWVLLCLYYVSVHLYHSTAPAVIESLSIKKNNKVNTFPSTSLKSPFDTLLIPLCIVEERSELPRPGYSCYILKFFLWCCVLKQINLKMMMMMMMMFRWRAITLSAPLTGQCPVTGSKMMTLRTKWDYRSRCHSLYAGGPELAFTNALLYGVRSTGQ